MWWEVKSAKEREKPTPMTMRKSKRESAPNVQTGKTETSENPQTNKANERKLPRQEQLSHQESGIMFWNLGGWRFARRFPGSRSISSLE